MRKQDVLAFSARFEDNLFELHARLRAGSYRHDPYTHFYVHDPKRRYISEPTVNDRIIHQAIMQVLEPIFECQFIFDSYSSRKEKGVHAAVERLEKFLRQASQNYSRQVYVLKCDIQKFYDSVRHDILLDLLSRTIHDHRANQLLYGIIKSYSADNVQTKGLPLGNATSQLFTNIYLNELDHFVKERLRRHWYARFCDDFIIVGHPNENLEALVPQLQVFLKTKYFLSLHPKKVYIRKLSQGVDFVGQIVRKHYRVIRTSTKRRLLRRMRLRVLQYQKGYIADEELRQSLQAGLGTLKHGSNYKVLTQCRKEIARLFRPGSQ